MKMNTYDLIIKAGKVFCSDTKLNTPGAIGIKDGKIVEFNADIKTKSIKTLNYPKGTLLPGFIDLHTHPAPSHWKYGMEADRFLLSRGTTTTMSQGDAGSNNWDKYKKAIIQKSKIDIYMALSAANNGEEYDHPVFESFEDIDINQAVETIKNDTKLIWGISANLSETCTYIHKPQNIMSKVLEMAEKSSKPILYGMRWEPFDWEIKDHLALLRPNDVVTYCFHVGPGGLAPKGHVEDSVWEAKENGIKFDIGHGMNSFNFEVTETAIRDGFLPDSISTDYYYRHTNTIPIHDVPHTISKLIASGMNQNDAFERATFFPAKILGLEDQIGTLSIGSVADIVVVEQNTKNSELIDVNGKNRSGKLWEPVLTVKSGEII